MANDSILIQVQLGSPTRANINAVTRQIQSALSNVSANVQISNGRQAAQQLQTIKNKTDSATKSMNSFGEAIGLSGRRFLAFTSAVAVVGRLTSALSQATREAIKFEREFVKLAQVFDTDVKSLGRLQNSMSELAQEFGLSATVIAKTSVVLAQSGLNARQTEQAMRTLAKTTLASTFENIASTTEGAVAIMAQFGTQASLLESQLGAINAVSKKFAVESGDIIEAVRRAGGAFRAAGGNFEDFIALFTAVRSTTRESAETIATGFRTIFARIQRPRTIEFFRELNIELTNGRGNFIGAFQAIRRLSDGLQRAGIEAGSLKFASVVEQLGGIRQVSRVIPLLGEFAKAERARQVAQQGAASLDADVAKAQETLAQAFARTTENFRALIREISQTESFQSILQIALSLANAFIEVARSVKPLIPLITALGAVKIGGLAAGALKKGLGGAGGTGGLGQGFNKGGFVPGTGNSDTVPAMLTPGEFVIRKSAVQAFGADNLGQINKYADGGKASRSTNIQIGKGVARRIGTNTPISATGRQLSRVSKSVPANNKVYTLDKVDTQSYNTKSNALIANMIGLRRKYGYQNINKWPNWRIFETAVSVVNGNLKIAGGSSPFDYPNVPGDAKYIPGGATYPTDDKDRVKGNNNETFLAKLALSGRTKARKATSYYPESENVKRNINGIIYAYTRGDSKKIAKEKYGNAKIPRYAKGGAVGTDTVPALLTPGEFVINKKSAETFGYGNLKKINKYNKGGVVGVQKFQDGGNVSGSNILSGVAAGGLALSVVFSALGEEAEGITKALSTTAVTIGILGSVLASSAAKGKKFRGLFSKKAEKEIEDGAKKVAEATTKVEKPVDDFGKELKKVVALLRSVSNKLGGIRTRSGTQRVLGSRTPLTGRQARLAGVAGFQTPEKIATIRGAGKVGAAKGVAGKVGGAGGAGGAAAAALEIGIQVAQAALVTSIAGVSATFSIAADSAKKMSEQFIEAGNAEEAGQQARLAAEQESMSSAVTVLAGGAAAIGTFVGGPLAGIIAGFAALAIILTGGQDIIQSFFDTMSNVVVGILEIGVKFGLVSTEIANAVTAALPDPKLAADLAQQQAEFQAQIKKTEKEIKKLGDATKIFKDELSIAPEDLRGDLVQKQADKLTQFANTVDQSGLVFEKNGETVSSLQDTIDKLNAKIERNSKTFDGNARERNRETEQLKQRVTQTQKEIETAKQASKQQLDSLKITFEAARANQVFGQTLKRLTKDGKVQLDQQGRVTKETIQSSTALNNIYAGLIASGSSENQARVAITKAILGEKSAMEQLREVNEKLTTSIGSELRPLLFGAVDEQIKAASRINAGIKILQTQDVAGLSSGQRGAGLDFIRTLGNAGLTSFQGQELTDILEGIFRTQAGREGQEGQNLINVFDQLKKDGAEGKKQADAFLAGLFGIDVTQLRQLEELENINENLKSTKQQDVNLNEGIVQAVGDINPKEKLTKTNDHLKNILVDVRKEAQEPKTVKNEESARSFAKKIGSGGYQPTSGTSYFVPGYAAGGTIVNFQPQGTDTVPAMLTPGEFVIQKSAVDKYGAGFMNSVNSGAFAKGGFINPIYRQNGGPTEYEKRKIASQRIVYGIGPEVPDALVAQKVRQIIANRQKQRISSSTATVDAALGGTRESRATARQAARRTTERKRQAAREAQQRRLQSTQTIKEDLFAERDREIAKIMETGVNRRVAAKRVSLRYQRSRDPNVPRSGSFAAPATAPATATAKPFSFFDNMSDEAKAPFAEFFDDVRKKQRREQFDTVNKEIMKVGPEKYNFRKPSSGTLPEIDPSTFLRKGGMVKPSYFQNGGAVGSTRIEGASELINASNSLKEAAATLPQTITMDLGGQSVNVNINGGELLRELMPQISNMVKTSIVNELIDFEDIQTSNSTPGAYASIKKAEQYGDRA